MPNQRLLYLLLPLLAGEALIVFGEALSDLWKEDVKALFQQNKWLLLAFVVLLALVVYFLDRDKRGEKPASEAVDIDQNEEAFIQFKANLLEQYRIRLKTKTANRLPINLTAKPTHFGTSPERIEAYFKHKDLTIESEDIATEIGKILDTHGRLLLIGDPGAGKTTILLYAAINILNDVREQKLPLLLNLATWDDKRNFIEWYTQNIAHTYSLSPVFVKTLLQRNAVVPFFDGFDEVQEKYRNDCFQKMAVYFGDLRSRQLIVSSRKIEYAQAKADAPVYAEIEVQPLLLAQIKKALSENANSQAGDRALLHALDRDEWLGKAVETPFYLNTASFLFGKSERTLANFKFKANKTKGRQDELVEIFVAEQVADMRDQTYLHFVADKMNTRTFPVFELLSMQPDWCKSLWWYHLSELLILGLLGGLLGGLVFSLVFGFVLGLFGFMVFGLLSGFGLSLLSYIIAGLVYNLLSSKIHTKDIQNWRWRTVIKNWKRSLSDGLAIFFCFGVFSLLVVGLVIGLVVGLKEAGTTTNFLLHVPSPYQRFWATFRRSFWVIPTFLLAIVLQVLAASVWKELTTWIQNPGFWLKFLPLGLVLLLLPLMSSYFLHHFALRLVLYLEGKMPLRVVTFMDRMTDQHIFEDNRRTIKGKKMRGATWRFRHKILQDYFAKMEVGK